MRIINKPPDHLKNSFNKVGVLLVNLGTPEGTDYFSMRKYLNEFLSDRRVIDVFKPLWWLILNGPILLFRPSKSGKAYKRIWNNNKGSPLKYITESQISKLGKEFKANNNIILDYAMRYGQPSIVSKLDKLFDLGCAKILIFPLYPQYAASTTASVQDEVYKWLLNKRWQPAIRTIAPWYDYKNYINSISDTIRDSFKKNGKTDVLMISFHGVPRRYLLLGDPYHCHCVKTGRLIKENLKWPDEKFFITFQSRFGPEQWLEPYTDETIVKLAQQGTNKITIASPGFVTDCLETLDEIKNEAKELFIQNGGKKLNYVNCLNDTSRGINLYKELIIQNLQGWINFDEKS